ncbi:hypothetical protein GTR04_7011 [Trichophyton interdigitale]|nr:hypothetical protein GY631_7490 [Trichophyton interdigitale]KAG5217109.1 hypothetical protein GY632_6880 [Trichophyton interdigitale]KAG8205601.1 hypothetical protein GTR04_7011 [Trichophyton interdigitale]
MLPSLAFFTATRPAAALHDFALSCLDQIASIAASRIGRRRRTEGVNTDNSHPETARQTHTTLMEQQNQAAGQPSQSARQNLMHHQPASSQPQSQQSQPVYDTRNGGHYGSSSCFLLLFLF